jgi:plasmid maintenance system antidote protein VapI
MSDALDEIGMLTVLRRHCTAIGSQRKAAEAMGISESRMSNILCGREPITPTVANALGYQIRKSFVPVARKVAA